MQSYDVLIIGGGPAGAMTGIELQKKGFSTCIIDKASFPRTKLCGGLLTQKSMDLVTRHCPGLDPEDFIVERAHTVDFYYEGKQVNRFHTNAVYYLTERMLFDDRLIRYYLEHGGKIMQHIAIKQGDIHFRDNAITIDSKKVGYTYLVGADGCSGVLSKTAHIRRHDYLCLEGNLPRDPDKEKELRIYFGVAKKGYGWYFPKKEHYCTGMGGIGSGSTLRDQANRFFNQVSDLPVQQVKGAFIPSGKRLKARHIPNNVLPVGDAAGFADPVTGEGIYYAMRSGLLAAHAIDASAKNKKTSAKNKKRNALRLYNKDARTIRKNIRAALFWQKILYYPPVFRAFMKHLQTHKNFAFFYLEKVIATGEFNYRNFVRVYFSRRNRTFLP
ncbi:MAG: geranylgeranyl reductase family protein [Bacteroidales bacterium]|jgi:geranylgeranyl reductase family protein|nr:geranylgeranyl reductase family protein [Bacteroidales bacterium]